MTIRLRHLGPDGFTAVLPDLLRIYVEAMGYPPQTGIARAPLWIAHARRPDFSCVIAHDTDDVIRGFCYGYRGAPGQWWHDEVTRGLRRRSFVDTTTATETMTDYFELTELHVMPGHQGGGIGEQLLRSLLTRVVRARVLLSTPEGPTRAWRLYRRLGFTDVLRDFLFTGDPRPFAVLAHPLPLDPPAPKDTSYLVFSPSDPEDGLRQ